ncbi:hypothetical protein IEQ34_008071 [Dendrobium chrysotoxum]|uniref:sucrose synthase n=1 Tax=Dendrobium chrysotoxum TaxID=161865 RepID=A0AAV7H756_DENCH|nr:hypothetical protein IEQ34_008071 [Dendrobium chrysotoxum]
MTYHEYESSVGRCSVGNENIDYIYPLDSMVNEISFKAHFMEVCDGLHALSIGEMNTYDKEVCGKATRNGIEKDFTIGVEMPDQVQALESEMLLRIKQQGLDITPKIIIVTRLLPDAVGTKCLPFRTDNEIIRKWISHFEVWPYLETYVDDVANELARELQATSNFIIGNYSDGNLIASLLAHKLGVTQYTIAHALKKTKYPNSDMYWKNFKDQYHFFYQFTTDLIAINQADFIIMSTFQEFAGRQGLSRLYDHDSNPQTTHVVWTLGYLILEVMRIGTTIISTDVSAFCGFLREDMYKRIKIFYPRGLLMAFKTYNKENSLINVPTLLKNTNEIAFV